MKKIILGDVEPDYNCDSNSLARIITSRLGLIPRKEGSTDALHKILLELYERTKIATRDKKPEAAIMTVEEMASFAGITKQTMYEHLEKWLNLDFLVKISYISGEKIVKGYRLNGTTLEEAFTKAKVIIGKNLDLTQKYIQDLQKMLKNEKISATIKKKEENN
jgi:hypothetical protein